MIDVTTQGVANNGTTDVTAPLQALIDSLPVNGSALYFPAGGYLVSATIDLSRLNSVTLQGDGFRAGSSMGSSIRGSVNGDLLRYTPSTGNCLISGLDIRNTHSSGTSLHLEGVVQSSVEHCQVSGNVGIYAPANNFSLALRSVCFNGSLSSFPNGIGLNARSGGGMRVESCDVSGWAEGLRISGDGVSVIQGRYEVNLIAINAGIYPTGLVGALSPCVIQGMSFESNGTAIQLGNCGGSVDSVHIIGADEVGRPVTYGIRVTGALSESTISNSSVSGSFSRAAISIEHSCDTTLFRGVKAVNAHPSVQPAWDVMVAAGIMFLDCNYGPGGAPYLAATDLLNPFVSGRNVRGKNVPVPAGASTLAVAFTSAFGSGNAEIGQPVAVQYPAGTLQGTYYYIGSAVTQRGECAAYNAKSVTVLPPNNAVQVGFLGGHTADGWKRRVYRGTTPGVWDGYFELPLNSSIAFVDSGQPFTALRSPLVAGQDDTSMIEPDSNYGVWVTPSWNTNFWVTGKLTTGFTVNFGTPSPGGTVDWGIVR